MFRLFALPTFPASSNIVVDSSTTQTAIDASDRTFIPLIITHDFNLTCPVSDVSVASSQPSETTKSHAIKDPQPSVTTTEPDSE